MRTFRLMAVATATLFLAACGQTAPVPSAEVVPVTAVPASTGGARPVAERPADAAKPQAPAEKKPGAATGSTAPADAAQGEPGDERAIGWAFGSVVMRGLGDDTMDLTVVGKHPPACPTLAIPGHEDGCAKTYRVVRDAASFTQEETLQIGAELERLGLNARRINNGEAQNCDPSKIDETPIRYFLSAFIGPDPADRTEITWDCDNQEMAQFLRFVRGLGNTPKKP